MLNQHMYTLQTIAKQMVTPGKGILAADETIQTTDKRFAPIHLDNTPETRREFREMLLTTKEMGTYISGAILFDETIRDSINGKSFADILTGEGVLPGIKVDAGRTITPINESVTKGLDGLDSRLKEYVKLGATFCKWRSLFFVTDSMPTPRSGPTDENILQNAKDMAQYALLCQQNGLVPIVEPEILMDGAHTRQQAGMVSEKVLTVVFDELKKASVALDGLILKTSMVISGNKSGEKETPEDVAMATIALFKKIIPDTIAGIVFLSGGQSEIQATENLNAMHQLGTLPWPITFSYSRALEESAIRVWQGKQENIPAAQKIFLHRAKMNSLASLGKYSPEMENE